MKKIIAYYLPQYHETPENNKWWGQGFTEWTNIKNAVRYSRKQTIRKPTELGYYDLSSCDIMERQFNLAKEHNISGFCLWTYWFGEGKKLLDAPLRWMLEKDLAVDYCVAWANHSWLNKTKGILLQEQKYLGEKDYEDFFDYMLPHFKREQYINDNGRPIVVVFEARAIPDFEVFISTFNRKAQENGFPGIYLITEYTKPEYEYVKKVDAFLDSSLMYSKRGFWDKVRERLVRRHRWKWLGPVKYSYKNYIVGLWNKKRNPHEKEIPVIISGWDTTPRHKRLGVIYEGFDENLFTASVKEAMDFNKKSQYVFLKSWNEWAEGNTVEPDTVYGRKLLEAIKKHNV